MSEARAIEVKPSWFWFKVWFGFAAAMLVLTVLTKADFQTIGLCFLAWCGGVLSTLMVQEHYKRQDITEDSSI